MNMCIMGTIKIEVQDVKTSEEVGEISRKALFQRIHHATVNKNKRQEIKMAIYLQNFSKRCWFNFNMHGTCFNLSLA